MFILRAFFVRDPRVADLLLNAVKVLPLFVFFLLISLEASASERPNILFIFTDDQSHRTISSYEDAISWANTPHIDRLAEEGIRFKHAFAGPWCAPSRAMVLTGKYIHGIDGLDFSEYPLIKQDLNRFRMWPETFRKNGYTTAVIGKWHLASDYAHGKVWDHSIIWERLGYEKSGSYFRDQRLRFDGGDFTPVNGHSTDNYTRYAKNFIERDHEQPWMLWLCYDAVHAPFTPADRHAGAYDQAGPIEVPEDIYPPRPTKPKYMRDYAMFEPNEKGEPVDERLGLTLSELTRKYHSGVLSIDEGVKGLMDTLERTGQLESTLVVFTSDQGLAMGHHGMEIKVAPYDDNIRVPFIVRLPGKQSAGRVVESPVNAIDLAPTFFDYAGIELPWEMHGDSLRPLMESRSKEWDRAILQQNFSMAFGDRTDVGLTQPNPNQGIDWWIFLRSGRYKYIATLVPDEIEELYDIEADPRELENLALNPAHRVTLDEMRDRMKTELERKGAKLVDNLPKPRRDWE